MLVQGDVHAQQKTVELTGESLLAVLDKSFHAQRLVASGHPRVRDGDSRGPLARAADEIVSAMRPDGAIESLVATRGGHGTRNTPAGTDGIDAGRVKVDLVTRMRMCRGF